jgi:hypothetical protein
VGLWLLPTTLTVQRFGERRAAMPFDAGTTLAARPFHLELERMIDV